MMKGTSAAIMAAVLATSAGAAPADPPKLVVVGRGSVKTLPDIAALTFTIRGEGVSSDAATGELVRKRVAIVAGLTSLVGSDAALSLGELSILESRDRTCEGDDDSNRPRLSTGSCAVRGYVAEVRASLRLRPVRVAGTALALATRLGASNARVGGFELADPEAARMRAEAAAVVDAQKRAVAIAAAAGSRVGELIGVSDQAASVDSGANDIVVTAALAAAPPVVTPPPVVVDLTPEPVETSATMIVTYGLTR